MNFNRSQPHSFHCSQSINFNEIDCKWILRARVFFLFSFLSLNSCYWHQMKLSARCIRNSDEHVNDHNNHDESQFFVVCRKNATILNVKPWCCARWLLMLLHKMILSHFHQTKFRQASFSALLKLPCAIRLFWRLFKYGPHVWYSIGKFPVPCLPQRIIVCTHNVSMCVVKYSIYSIMFHLAFCPWASVGQIFTHLAHTHTPQLLWYNSYEIS